MARWPFKRIWYDTQNRVVTAASVTVYLAGGSTLATCYESEAGAVISGSVVTTDSVDGSFEFWVDDADYSSSQRFRVVGVKSGFVNLDVDDIPVIFGLGSVPVISDFTNAIHNHSNAAGGGSTLSSPTIETPTIASFVNAGHDHQNAVGGGSTLTSPTLVTPTIASFANAGHDHADAAGGGATLNSPTVVTPVIADFTNATHDHTDAAGGGNLGQASVTDLTITGSAASPPDTNTITKESIVKAWANFNGTGVPAYNDSFNFTGAITDNGTGDYTLTINTDFANATYASIGTVTDTNSNSVVTFDNKAVSSIDVQIAEITVGVVDRADVSVILIGDQ